MAESDAVETQRLLRPDWRTAVVVALGILGVVVVRNVFVAAHQVLGWAVAASLVALFITPVIRTLDVALPRPLAVVVGFVLLIATIVGAGAIYSIGVRDEIARLDSGAPEVAQRIEERSDRIGQFATDIGLADQIAEVTASLRDRIGSGGDALRDAALAAPSYLVTMILTIFLLIYGARLVRGGLGQLPPSRRDRLGPALSQAARRSQVYVAASVVQGVLSGLAVFGAATLLDAPARGLLALMAAVVSMLPYVGIFLGWLPVIVLALGLGPLWQPAVVALVAIGLQVAEGFVWRPHVDARSIHLGPALPFIAAVLGWALYGIGGSLCSFGLVVLTIALADQLTGVGQLPTPLDD